MTESENATTLAVEPSATVFALLTLWAWLKVHVVGAAASLLIHGLVVLVPAGIILKGDSQEVWSPLEAVFRAPVEESSVPMELVTTPMVEELRSSAVPESSRSSISTFFRSDARELPETEVDLQLPESFRDTPISSRNSGGTGDGNGNNGNGQGNGDGKAQFFGEAVAAESVVYVIDGSGSMTGARFQQAGHELIQALSNLTLNQTFCVLFYTDKTNPLFWPKSVFRMQPANAATMRKTFAWLKNVHAQGGGGTQSQKAMTIALDLKPKVIFLLSDGDIPETTVDVVRSANRGTIIHIVALGDDIGGGVLRQIAEETQGQYRFIADEP